MATRDRSDDHDKDQDPDPKGERGGDTGNTDQKGKGVQAEKGDQRRENPVHSGPTRGKGSAGPDTGRTGSESNASQ